MKIFEPLKDNMQSLFEGLKVVELASVLAGPAVGNFFSELGAEVIKVENKSTGGDITRQWRLPNETKKGPSAYYASINWNKKSIQLDLTERGDNQMVCKLIQEADIIITNFKKGDDLKFGLSYEEVKTMNSAIIYGRISGFGTEDARVAYDLILQAETGFMTINGQPESPPTKMPLALIDLLAAHQLKEGILCALLKQKDKPHKPFLIDVSLYESAVASLINQATNWLMNGNIPQRMGSLHPNIAPYGEIFTTKDNRSVTLAIGTNDQFKKLCDILNRPSLADQSWFKSNSQRVKHREGLYELLQAEFQKVKATTLLEDLQKHRVPAGEIKNLEQVFTSEQAENLLLKENMEGRETIRPRTTVFQMRS